jgi:hypothetical protein
MLRLRLRYTNWPRPAIELTDTPRPNCPTCHGDGGWPQDYGNPETGDYEGTRNVTCDCWQPQRAWFVLAVPRSIARRWLGAPELSDGPPF